jgi:hypothetical protein
MKILRIADSPSTWFLSELRGGASRTAQAFPSECTNKKVREHFFFRSSYCVGRKELHVSIFTVDLKLKWCANYISVCRFAPSVKANSDFLFRVNLKHAPCVDLRTYCCEYGQMPSIGICALSDTLKTSSIRRTAEFRVRNLTNRLNSRGATLFIPPQRLVCTTL